MKKIAAVFPGQGAQVVGMGQELYEQYEAARNVFHLADEILGFKLSELCFSGPEEQLNDTWNTQPAVYVTSYALYEVLREAVNQPLSPFVTAGHSLGEYTALAVSGAFSFEDGLRLVRERGRLMKEAGGMASGGMMAVIGAETSKVRELTGSISAEKNAPLIVANDNCPGQVVISGADESLAEFNLRYKTVGARMVRRLPVSVACHSPLMGPAQSELAKTLEATSIRDASIPVCGNTTAKLIYSRSDIMKELQDQLCGPVLWADSVQEMVSQGVDTFIEVGPGQVLTGMIRRINPSVQLFNVGSANDISQIQETAFLVG